MSEYKLTSEILALSAAKNWGEAKLEWRLQGINPQGKSSTCLCGHHPIVELCTIANQKTGLSAVVGNCCVKKFLGLPAHKIFQAIKRVQKDPGRALNAETIEYAHQKRWINQYERDFYFNTMRMRSGGKLTAKRLKVRREINDKILKRWLAPAHFSPNA